MNILELILLVLALVCFVVNAAGAGGKINMAAAGKVIAANPGVF